MEYGQVPTLIALAAALAARDSGDIMVCEAQDSHVRTARGSQIFAEGTADNPITLQGLRKYPTGRRGARPRRVPSSSVRLAIARWRAKMASATHGDRFGAHGDVP